jgi:hypothetical protein
MFDDDLDSQSAPATMFPFLSVLFCTIGALVIIMVIGSKLTTVKGEGVDTKLKDMRARAMELAKLSDYVSNMKNAMSSIREAEAKSASFNNDAKSANEDYEEEKVGLADLEAKGTDDKTYVEKAGLAMLRHSTRATHATTETRWRASKTEVDNAQREKTDLDLKITTARKEIGTLKKDADNPVVTFRFDGDSEGRKPVFLELTIDSVLVHSDGAPLPKDAIIMKDDASGRAGFFEKLAASLTRPGANRYAVLLVQPEAVDLFFAATEKLRRRRAPYAAEPIEKDWTLVFDSGEATPN